MSGIQNVKKMTCSIAGRPISGKSSQADWLKIEPMTPDQIISQTGMEGEWNISEQFDSRHKLTITLMGDSPDNAFLFGLMKARASFPVLFKDPASGGETGFSAQARVLTQPPIERGKEYKDKVWVILMPDYKGVPVV